MPGGRAVAPARLAARELSLAAALIVAGVFISYAHVARDFVIANDSVGYLKAARDIQEHGAAAVKTSLRQPLYPAVLWAAGRIRQGVNPDFAWRGGELAEAGKWAGLIQHAAFLAAAWFFFRRLAGARLAPWCLLATIVHPLFGFYFANVLSEALYLTFFALGLAFLVAASEAAGGKPWGAFGWGLCAGLAAALAFLTRVEGQILLLGGLAYFLWRGVMARRAGGRGGIGGWFGAAAGLAAGAVTPALPFLLYIKATSARYSWEWVWQRISDLGQAGLFEAGLSEAGLSEAGSTLAASPAAAAGMFFGALVEHAPLVFGLAVAGFVLGAYERAKGRPAGGAGAKYGVVLVVGGCNALAILVGATIQNAAVSQRYIEPLVVMAIPAAAIFVTRLADKRRGARTLAVALGGAALAAAFIMASHKWDSYKTGYRGAGAAIAEMSEGVSPRVLTSCSRVAFYADAANAPVTDEKLAEEIETGAAGAYDYVVLESKNAPGDTLARYKARLESVGFTARPELEFPEDKKAGHRDDRVMVFSKGHAA